MAKSLIRAYRGFIREYRDRLDHDRCMSDPRTAADHRIANQRCRDEGRGSCPFCA